MALRDLFRRRPSRTSTGPAGEASPSLAQLRAVLHSRPDHVAARLALAERLADMGETDRAIAEYERVVDVYVEQDLHGKAIRLLERITESAPGRTDLLERMGRLSEVDLTLPRRDLHIARLARRPPGSLLPSSLQAAELRRYWNELGASRLVTRANDDALAVYFACCEVQHFSPMSTVARAGQSYPRCYWLVEGVIDTRFEGLPILRLAPGDVFGDRAMIRDSPWPADYVTANEGTTTVLTMTRAGLARAGVDDRGLTELLDGIRSAGRDDEIVAAVTARSG